MLFAITSAFTVFATKFEYLKEGSVITIMLFGVTSGV